MNEEGSGKMTIEGEEVENIADLLSDSYCENCQSLRKELEKLQAEQSLNYTTLKEKIISTDLLIKKYTSKCQEYDEISKKSDELTKKLDQYRRDCELLEERLKTTLKDHEPLKQEKLQLAARCGKHEADNRSLRDRLEASEASGRMFMQAQTQNENKIKDYENQILENKKKVKEFEQNTRKQDSLIKKLQADLAARKIDLSEQKKLTSKIITIKDKAEEKSRHYEEVLRRNGLFQNALQSASRGLRRKIQNDQRKQVQIKQEDASSDEEFLLEKLFKDEDSELDDICLFRPLGGALSPLPPSPPRLEGDVSGSDEESIVELADVLENEILRGSSNEKRTKSVRKMRSRPRGSMKGRGEGKRMNPDRDKMSDDESKPTRLVESGLTTEGVLTLQESLSDPETDQGDDGSVPFQFTNNDSRTLQSDLTLSASSTSESESDSGDRTARRRSPRNQKKFSQNQDVSDDVPVVGRRRTRSMSQDSGSESDSAKHPTPAKSPKDVKTVEKASQQSKSPFKEPLPVLPRRSRRRSKTETDMHPLNVVEPRRVTRSKKGGNPCSETEVSLSGSPSSGEEKHQEAADNKHNNELNSNDESSPIMTKRKSATKKRRREVEEQEDSGPLPTHLSPKSKSPKLEESSEGSELDDSIKSNNDADKDGSKAGLKNRGVSSFLEDLQNAFRKSPLAVHKNKGTNRPQTPDRTPLRDTKVAQCAEEILGNIKKKDSNASGNNETRRRQLTAMKGITPLRTEATPPSSHQELKENDEPATKQDTGQSTVRPLVNSPTETTLQVESCSGTVQKSPEHRPLSKTSSTGFILRTLEEDLTDLSGDKGNSGPPGETDKNKGGDSRETGQKIFTLGSPEESPGDSSIVQMIDKNSTEHTDNKKIENDENSNLCSTDESVMPAQNQRSKEENNLTNINDEPSIENRENECKKQSKTAPHLKESVPETRKANSVSQRVDEEKIDSVGVEKVGDKDGHLPEEHDQNEPPSAVAVTEICKQGESVNRQFTENHSPENSEKLSVEKDIGSERGDNEHTEIVQENNSDFTPDIKVSNTEPTRIPNSENGVEPDETVETSKDYNDDSISKGSASPCPSEGEDGRNPSLSSSKNRAMLKRQFSVECGNRAGELSSRGANLRNRFVGATKMPPSPSSGDNLQSVPKLMDNDSKSEGAELSQGQICDAKYSEETACVPKIIVSNTDSSHEDDEANISPREGSLADSVKISNEGEEDNRIPEESVSVGESSSENAQENSENDSLLPTGDSPVLLPVECPDKQAVLLSDLNKEENDDSVSQGNVSVICQFDEESYQSLPSLSGSDSGSFQSQSSSLRPSFLPLHPSFDSNSTSDSHVGTPESQQLSVSTPQDVEELSNIDGEASEQSGTPTNNIISPSQMGEGQSPVSPLPPSPMNKTDPMNPISPFAPSDQSEALSPLSFTFSDTEDIGNPISPLPPSPVPLHRQLSESPDIAAELMDDDTSIASIQSSPSSPYLCTIKETDSRAGPSTSASTQSSSPPPLYQPKARIAHCASQAHKDRLQGKVLVTAKGKATPGIPAKSSKKKPLRPAGNSKDSQECLPSGKNANIDVLEKKEDMFDGQSVASDSSMTTDQAQKETRQPPDSKTKGRPPKRKTVGKTSVPNKIQCKSTSLHRAVITKESTVSLKSLEKEIMQLIRKQNMNIGVIASRIAKLSPSGFKKPIVDALLKACMSQELDLLSSLYTKCCKTTRINQWEPFLADHELAITCLLLHLDKGNLFKGIVQLFLTSASKIILERSMTSVLVRVSLCRMCTALCRQKGDVNQTRVLLYDIIESQVPGFTTLTLGVASVWPGLLCRTLAQGPQKLIESMEYVVMKRVSGEKIRLTKLAACLRTLCQWSPPDKGKDATWMVRDTLEHLKTELDKPKPRGDVVYELEQSLILLGATEEWSWTNNVMTVEVMWPQLQAWCMEQMGRLQSGVSTRMAESLLRVTGYVMSRCPASQSSSAEDIIKTTSHLVYGVPGATIPENIQRTALEALLRLAPFNPQAVAGAACHWVSGRREERKRAEEAPDGLEEAALINSVKGFRECYTNILLSEDLKGLVHL